MASSAAVMDPGTTGTVVNRGGLTLIVSFSNDSASTQTVELEVLSVTLSTSPVTKTGAAHQLFAVPPLTVITKTFNIAGFPAYEFQAVVSNGNVVLGIFVVDAAGNLVAAERVLNQEGTFITTLTPLP